MPGTVITIQSRTPTRTNTGSSAMSAPQSGMTSFDRVSRIPVQSFWICSIGGRSVVPAARYTSSGVPTTRA